MLRQLLLRNRGAGRRKAHLEIETPRLKKGFRLAHYRVERFLGRGGMGEVYEATDTRLRRKVAIKLLTHSGAEDPKHRRRLLREARAVAAVRHPGVVTVFEIQHAEPYDFIVMELVAGKPLTTGSPATSPLPFPDLINLGTQISDAMAAAHRAGVIHRDLKPQNVMIDSLGRVKILDFGIAKLEPQAEIDTLDGEVLTSTGATPGTLAYMSPEQVLGEDVDHRTDIFSLGVLLFELATGQRPFAVTDPDEPPATPLRRLLFCPAPDPRDFNPDLSDGLVELIESLLQKSPDERPQSMDEVHGALLDLAPTRSSEPPELLGEVPPVVDRPDPDRRDLDGSSAGKRRPMLLMGLGLGLIGLAWWVVEGFPGFVPGPALLPQSATESVGGQVESAAPGDDLSCPVTEDGTAGEDPAYRLWQAGEAQLERFDRHGNVARAIACFEDAVARQPDLAPAHAGLSRAYRIRAREHADEHWRRLSLASARRAVEAAPRLTRARLSLARAWIQDGRLEEAEVELARLAELDPGEPGIVLGRAKIAFRRDDLESAVELYREAVRLQPKSWIPWSHLGDTLHRQGRYGEAASAFEQGLALTPDNAVLWRSLAAARQHQGDYPGTIEALQHSLTIHPTMAGFSNLGTAYFFQGFYNEAAAAFEDALAVGANDLRVWANLGDAYRQIPGRAEQARESYERAVQLVRAELSSQPNDPQLQSRLALYLARIGDTAAARAAMPEPGPNLYFQSPSAWFRACLTYEAMGERDRALDALGEALRRGYPLSVVEAEPELVELRQDVAFHRLARPYGAK